MSTAVPPYLGASVNHQGTLRDRAQPAGGSGTGRTVQRLVRGSEASGTGALRPAPLASPAPWRPPSRQTALPNTRRPQPEKRLDLLSDVSAALRSLQTLREVGLGYLRLGQPATELSGGEAQRIKLATELQRPQSGHTLYLPDEPTTGLHPADVQLLMTQLHRLVDAGNTVIVVEHEMDVVAAADWVIDPGPAGGDGGGEILAAGAPAVVARSKESRTAPYLAAACQTRLEKTVKISS
ncbi:hypothetical protein QFZ79_003821 [Arthrobacter sp. V4I6]|nr:hypothetical protein [Arthrobacter sp. V1I7]MDQ0855710.1 hypothetical protein [Arthrobacter sp. V4I6]